MISEEMERIEKRLKDLGHSKTDFAIALGAPEANASAYYNNWRNRGLPKSRLDAAAFFLDAPIEWITKGERRLTISGDLTPNQYTAGMAVRRLAGKGFITAACTVSDRVFFVAGLLEDEVTMHLSIVSAPGGINSLAIKGLIESGALSRRIRLSADEYNQFSEGDVKFDDLFRPDKTGFWDRIEIISHDSIYTPEVRDVWGKGSYLPEQLGRIMELYEDNMLDLDDLILLETIALRLSSGSTPQPPQSGGLEKKSDE